MNSKILFKPSSVSYFVTFAQEAISTKFIFATGTYPVAPIAA